MKLPTSLKLATRTPEEKVTHLNYRLAEMQTDLVKLEKAVIEST